MRNLLKWSAVLALGLALAAPFGASAAEPTVVTLTQVACQFVESENGVDHKYKSSQKADCEAINAKSGAERLAKAAPIKLKPGKYIFRVTNKNVPYTLGFWIRDKDYDWRNPLHKLSKTSVSGGGMTLGNTLDYEVDLKPGKYVYSCPLNTTPDYTLIVEG